MPTPRERLDELLNLLSDDQIETVLRFTEALRRGRVVVSACDIADGEARAAHPPEGLLKDTLG